MDSGDIAETQAIARLTALGYTVSIPLSTARYDLIAERDGELYRLQVKHGKLKDDHIYASLESTTVSTSKTKRSYYTPDEIDAFIIYSTGTNSCYWVNIEDAPKGTLRLRLKSQIDHPSIRWAADFEL